MNKKHIIIIGIVVVLLLIAALLLFLPKSGPEAPEDPTEESLANPSETGNANNTEHVHQWTSVVTVATCTETGFTTHTCDCGETYTDGETAATGHQWDAGVVTKEATEVVDGEIQYTCTVCGETDIRIIPSQNHVHQYEQIVTPPTCTEKGYTVFSCRCGDSHQDDEVAAKGHDWSAATCTETRVCKVCNTSDAAAKGHSWSDATCTAPKTCTVCGATEGSAKGHSYNSVVTDPTDTDQGYTTHTCTTCGDSYKDTYTDPIPANYEPGTLVFSADGIAALYGENNQIQKTYTGWGGKYFSVKYTPWYNEKDQITNVIIKNGVSPQFTDYWFSGCENLKSITIGNSLTNLSSLMLISCTNLSDIRIAADNPAFTTEDNLVIFSKDKTALVIASCTLEGRYTVPNGVTHIYDYAFAHCSKLTEVVIPEGVTGIGGQAFLNASGLTEIILPNTVVAVGDSAFAHCANLTRVTLSSSMNFMGQFVLYNCPKLEKVIIPEGIKYISYGAFKDSVKLKDVILPSTITKIDTYAFCNCPALTEINIPEGVDTIEFAAFQGCTGLTTITIPKELKFINDRAFWDCSNLSKIIFAGTVAQWEAAAAGKLPIANTAAASIRCSDGTVELK